MEKKQPLQNRAYSVFEVKEYDGDSRKFSGIATTPSVDRVGDIIEPLGVQFAKEIPLLWQHKHDEPIGHVRFGEPTEKGIPFDAEIVEVKEEGKLKDRIDEAAQSIKYGLVKAVSIGFRPIEYSFMDDGGVRYTKTEVYELSAVTIPANADAIISTIKSVDTALRKDAGVADPEIPAEPQSPAATGEKGRVVKLDDAPRDGGKPFVVREIKRTA